MLRVGSNTLQRFSRVCSGFAAPSSQKTFGAEVQWIFILFLTNSEQCSLNINILASLFFYFFRCFAAAPAFPECPLFNSCSFKNWDSIFPRVASSLFRGGNCVLRLQRINRGQVLFNFWSFCFLLGLFLKKRKFAENRGENCQKTALALVLTLI